MRLEILYIGFILISFLFVLSLTILRIFKEKLKNSGFAAFCATFLLLYVVFSILIFIFTKNPINKIIMLIFSLSPFLIGKFATYKYEKYFTVAQIITVLLSIIYVAGVLII